MKTTLFAVAGALFLASAIAVPALAQPYGPPGGPSPSPDAYHQDNYHQDMGRQDGDHHDMGRPEARGGFDLDHRIHWMQDRLARARAEHQLDRGEYRRAQFELGRIVHDESRARYYGGGRIPEGVVADLEGRLDRLNDRIHWLQHNDEHRPW